MWGKPYIGLAKSTLGLTYACSNVVCSSAREIQLQVYSIQVEPNCASIEFKNHCYRCLWWALQGLYRYTDSGQEY